ncbi:MAG TPA: TonB-dependent receptor [Candidatus Kapabacteria bacterium]|nr:TonB-dependent receptor [Candidatus Kapabacteria bacterium]
MMFYNHSISRAILFLFLSVLCPALAGAVSIRGTITSGGTPITGATVRLLELDRETHSGANGEYSFEQVPPGKYHVFVRTMGYASVTEAVEVTDSPAELSFSLTASAIPGEDVVVSATPYARPTSEQYQAVASKSQVEAHESPGASVAEEIEDIPGVSVRWNGSAPARPILRGLTDNDVLILENGLRTGDISAFDPAHAVPIEAAEVEEVDVVRGPASVMFGPNAVGGLVNVITSTVPEASDKMVSGRASIMGNSVSDLYSGYFNTTLSDGSAAFGISAGGLHSQDVKIPSGTYTDPATNQTYHLSAIPQSFDRTSEEGLGYSYTGGFGMIGAGAKHYAMNWGIPGDPWDPNQLDPGPTISRIQMDKYTVELRGLFNIGGSFIDQIRFNGNITDYVHSEHPTIPDSTGTKPVEFEQNNFHQNGYNATLQFVEQKMGGWQGTLGLWANFDNLNIGGLQPLGPNSLTSDVAGYIYEEYAASENTRLEGALRYDVNQISLARTLMTYASPSRNDTRTRNENAFTGSFGILQKLSPELTSSFSIGRSFRAPTVQELFGYGPDDASASFILGDAGLVPETGLEFDASLKGTMSGFSFEVSPFLNLISNYLYSYYTGTTDTTQQPNYPYRQFAQANARLFGFEASTSVQLVEHWALTASGSYVNASITNDSTTPLPFIPPLKGILRLDYLANVYSGTIEWRLAAPQYRLGPGDDSVAGYGVVNIGAGIRLTSGSAVHYIGVHCDNLFNQSYRDNLSVIHDFLPQPGRGFRLTYDVIF